MKIENMAEMISGWVSINAPEFLSQPIDDFLNQLEDRMLPAVQKGSDQQLTLVKDILYDLSMQMKGEISIVDFMDIINRMKTIVKSRSSSNNQHGQLKRKRALATTGIIAAFIMAAIAFYFFVIYAIGIGKDALFGAAVAIGLPSFAYIFAKQYSQRK